MRTGVMSADGYSQALECVRNFSTFNQTPARAGRFSNAATTCQAITVRAKM